MYIYIYIYIYIFYFIKFYLIINYRNQDIGLVSHVLSSFDYLKSTTPKESVNLKDLKNVNDINSINLLSILKVK